MTGGRRYRAVRTLRPQGAPPGIYASKFEWGLAVFICQRLAAGESLRSICRGDPAMPTEKTVWNWTQAHPEFAAMRDSALTTARAAARARHMARHEALAAARRARPPWSRRAWNLGRSGYGPEIVHAICQRLCLGEPLYIVCRDPAMPSQGTVYNWLRIHPEFVEAYRHAKEVAFDFVIETEVDRAPWLGTEAASMRALAKIERRAVARCGKLAPTTFAPGVYRAER